MRNYSKIDLVRYHKLALKYPELKLMEMLQLYDKTYRELTIEEKIANLKKFLKPLFKEIKNGK